MKTKKTILYAPHWDERFSSAHQDLNGLISSMLLSGCHIIASPHRYLFEKYPKKNFELAFERWEQHPKFVFLQGQNIISHIENVDGVVTDLLTSINAECAILKKPVWNYSCENGKKLLSEIKKGKNGIVYSTRETEKALARIAFQFKKKDQIEFWLKEWANGNREATIDWQRKLQEKFVRGYLYNPGDATEIASQIILEKIIPRRENRQLIN